MTSPTSDPSPNSTPGPSQLEMWTSSLEEPHAKLSASQAKEAALTTHAVSSCSAFWTWLQSSTPAMFYGRTSQASCRPVNLKDLTSDASFKGWSSAGMASHGESWTLNILEAPRNVAGESSSWPIATLSQVLETGRLPQRFYLSPKACLGILRRASKRGKDLPPMLKAALEQTAQSSGTEEIKQTPNT